MGMSASAVRVQIDACVAKLFKVFSEFTWVLDGDAWCVRGLELSSIEEVAAIEPENILVARRIEA